MKQIKIILTFVLLSSPIISQECFIVMDLKTDEILYIENEEYSNTLLYPGSLLKPFTMLSVINNQVSYNCTGWTDLNSRCWSRENHGNLNIEEALAYSCNSFFLQYLNGRLNLSLFHKTLSYYLEFQGGFSVNDYIQESIGLGRAIKVTPINMLKAYNKLYREMPEGIETIRQGMKEATYYGTAKTLSEEYGIIDAAAKTGTSYRITENGVDWRSNTGWFLLIYPGDSPRYSCLKVIDKSKSDLSVDRGSRAFKEWYEGN